MGNKRLPLLLWWFACLLVEDGLGLTTVARLLRVVAALPCSQIRMMCSEVFRRGSCIMSCIRSYELGIAIARNTIACYTRSCGHGVWSRGEQDAPTTASPPQCVASRAVALTLGVQAGLASLVLGNLVRRVLVALLAEGLLPLRDVHLQEIRREIALLSTDVIMMPE